MSDQVHAVEGYALCPCGNWVLNEIAARTGGICSACFQANGCERRRVIEVVGRGQRLELPLTKPRRKRRRSRPKSRTAEKAKAAARARVAAMFPDLYDIVLAEERARLGLKPWTTDMAVRAHEDPDGEVAVQFAELAAALEREGID